MIIHHIPDIIQFHTHLMLHLQIYSSSRSDRFAIIELFALPQSPCIKLIFKIHVQQSQMRWEMHCSNNVSTQQTESSLTCVCVCGLSSCSRPGLLNANDSGYPWLADSWPSSLPVNSGSGGPNDLNFGRGGKSTANTVKEARSS